LSGPTVGLFAFIVVPRNLFCLLKKGKEHKRKEVEKKRWKEEQYEKGMKISATRTHEREEQKQKNNNSEKV
jgi:hypothetical protein